jgi:predicted HicB family RNase H-like nuclease
MTFDMNPTAPYALNPQALDAIGNLTDGAGTDANAAKSKKKVSEAGERLAADMKVFQSVANELKAKTCLSKNFEDRCHWVHQVAAELFGVAPTWTAFYREILGVDGVAHHVFDDASDYRRYEASETHTKILEMLTVLRSRDVTDCDPTEPQRMITIRIPRSLHDSLCKESNDLEISVNKLCITRLVQRVDLSMLPTCPQKRRGRRPGPDYHKSLTKQQTAISESNS